MRARLLSATTKKAKTTADQLIGVYNHVYELTFFEAFVDLW